MEKKSLPRNDNSLCESSVPLRQLVLSLLCPEISQSSDKLPPINPLPHNTTF